MQESTFLILTALAAKPQHGYGIITDVAPISSGKVRLRAGTLYAALDRLESEGLIQTDREEIVDGRARRYYRLTADGTTRLSAEAQRLHRHAETAFARLSIPPGTVPPPAIAPGGLVTSLERRYRALLRWYPQWHRRLHEQEMLAVLLHSAAPAQQRPALSDALDLIRGGLRVRIHHAVGAPSAPHWRRAANIAALLGPLALFTLRPRP
ncbi:hypothetical protein ETD85_12380 [Nonomuraea zeae]|uniref:Transcription regulator PadR N-terminal domain-containing protein n=2 Tax=Nonomuraea zeae TaxID=1642303 RepID=A0A5S4HAL2_9ACTN|nr:hypothetical protein ETD85_12380 [Nonomuraea zeae]